MYLRRNRRKYSGECYDYWTLVESVRTSSGPRQRIVATVGKLSGLNDEVRVGWEHISEILNGRAHQCDFLRAEPEPPQWARVDVSRVRVERLRSLCRSPQRSEKERAMRERQVQRLEKELARLQLRCGAAKDPLRDVFKAERKIGALLARYSRAAHLYEVNVEQTDDAKGKKRLAIRVIRHDERRDWAECADGCYLLRTNLQGYTAEQLWRIYIGLTQIEDSFRISKHDLGLRPIYHRKQDRTQAHILICFLALVLWRTLQHWMTASGLGQAPRKLLEEMAEVRSLDVILPTAAGPELRQRVVSRPENHLAILLQRLSLFLPNKPKAIQNVVEKTTPHAPDFFGNSQS